MTEFSLKVMQLIPVLSIFQKMCKSHIIDSRRSGLAESLVARNCWFMQTPCDERCLGCKLAVEGIGGILVREMHLGRVVTYKV